MRTTQPLTDSPQFTDPESPGDSIEIIEERGSSRSARSAIDNSSAVRTSRVGVGLALTAATATLALVWTVMTGPDTVVASPSSHNQVELNRAATLRDLHQTPAETTDPAELNRAATLRDLHQTRTTSHDQVEANRAATLRDLHQSPTEADGQVEVNEVASPLGDECIPLVDEVRLCDARFFRFENPGMTLVGLRIG